MELMFMKKWSCEIHPKYQFLFALHRMKEKAMKDLQGRGWCIGRGSPIRTRHEAIQKIKTYNLYARSTISTLFEPKLHCTMYNVHAPVTLAVAGL
jgi:hypothetical protein